MNPQFIQIAKCVPGWEDHITLEDYEIKDGMGALHLKRHVLGSPVVPCCPFLWSRFRIRINQEKRGTPISRGLLGHLV